MIHSLIFWLFVFMDVPFSIEGAAIPKGIGGADVRRMPPWFRRAGCAEIAYGHGLCEARRIRQGEWSGACNGADVAKAWHPPSP